MSQRDKPQLALNNIMAGVREREDANRTREAGHLDEIQGVVANTLNLFRQGAVGFIVWLDEKRRLKIRDVKHVDCDQQVQRRQNQEPNTTGSSEMNGKNHECYTDQREQRRPPKPRKIRYNYEENHCARQCQDGPE